MDLAHIIDGLIALIVMGGGWFLSSQAKEVKRLDILLNKTREDYAKRDDVTVAINRLEEKIDRLLQRKKKADYSKGVANGYRKTTRPSGYRAKTRRDRRYRRN